MYDAEALNLKILIYPFIIVNENIILLDDDLQGS